MPRYSLRQQILKQLDFFIVLHTITRAINDDIGSYLQPPILPFFFTALTLLSTNNLDNDQSGNYGHQDSLIMMNFLMMTISTITHHSLLLHRKRKHEDNDCLFNALILVRNAGHKRRYIVPRLCKAPALSKAETFNDWFNKTNRTWLTVVCASITISPAGGLT